ncbi:hypothetical protein KS4_25460 [Poriferisphaera corsica]|uniref:Uncharacterized protein n=1 Tax=Poriferisphaera corsica TaxID=2528020 RepID=A0A517YW79_9BACT|nr:zinc ribbon domain-containing protein [Poriferisphaera corsica]QDU34476.1 hypothetical protein KS4_25460 [Poriferisphaera corsica]
MYDLNIPDDERGDVLSERKQAAPAHEGKCPACNQKIGDGAVLCIKCGFNLTEGKRLETAVVDEADAEAAKDKQKQEKTNVVRLTEADALIEKGNRAALAQGRDITKKKAGDEAMRVGADAEHRMKEYVIPGVSMVVMLLILGALTPIGWDASGTVNAISDATGWDLPVMMGYGVAYLLKAVFWVGWYIALWVGLIVLNALLSVGIGSIGSAIIKIGALASGVMLMSAVYGSVMHLLTGGLAGAGGIGMVVHIACILSLFYVLCYQFFEMEGKEPLYYFIISVGLPLIVISLIGMFLAM